MARCFAFGYETDMNLFSAFTYFQEAAEKGYVKAMHYLGLFALNGFINDINHLEAIKWFKKASEALLLKGK